MTSSGGVKSANRVFELLELFARRRTTMSAGEVSAELEWPLSSSVALLKSLSESGYFLQSENGRRYFPSVRLHNLTRWIDAEVFSVGANVQTLLHTLRDEFGETTTLSVRRGLHMEFVQILLGTNTVVMQVQEGDKFSLFGTAIGTAALAATTPQKVAALWDRARNLDFVTDAQKQPITDRIALCREQGYYAGYDQAVDGLGALAFPLTHPDASSTYVLAVAGLSNRMRQEEDKISRRAHSLIVAFQENDVATMNAV